MAKQKAKVATVPKIETFTWVGTNKHGAKLKGEINGSNVNAIKIELRRQGINPKSVRKKTSSLFSAVKKKIKSLDITIFTRQIATMLAAGLPLIQSFDLIGRGHSNPQMQTLILEIKASVESGKTLAEALAEHPKYFNELYCSLVQAGEQSGSLDVLLDRIATYKEKTESIKGKIKKALFYPIAVIIVAFIVTSILLIFVVPQFQDLFKSFGADLPTLTLFVINLSKFFQAYWWIIFGSFGLAIYGLVVAQHKSPAFAFQLDCLILKLPVVGEILRKAIITRFAGTLATTFAAGLPLVDALKSVAGATGNALYAQASHQIREEVSTGQPLQFAMAVTNLFPSMVVQMVAIGEESGNLEKMLNKVADLYGEEVDNAVDSLSSLIEPCIMAFLGIVIGGLVISMYLPIFKLGSVMH